MRISVEVEVAGLAEKAAKVGANRVAKIAGVALEETWRAYYVSRGGVFWPRLGKGGVVPGQGTVPRKTWGQEAGGGRIAVTVEGVWGAILQHKIKGGRIVAANAKNLAIPANAEARKKGSPRNFDSSFLRFVMFGKDGPKALVKAEPKKGKGRGGKRKKGAGKAARKRPEVWYWLKPSVTHRADPNALPPMAKLAEAVRTRVERYLARGGRP